MTLTETVESLYGWCTPEKAARLHELIISSNSQFTVELGCFGGRSLLPMALAHKEKQSGFVIGIDAWKAEVCLEGTNSKENDEYWANVDYKLVYDNCRDAIDKHDLTDYCDTLRMRSQVCGTLFTDNIIDVLHQDSSHNPETILAEIEIWIPKLKVGGYWIADDTDWKETAFGYSKLPEYGLKLVENFDKWQIWKKVK